LVVPVATFLGASTEGRFSDRDEVLREPAFHGIGGRVICGESHATDDTGLESEQP